MQRKAIKANGKSNLRNPIQKDCISNWPRIFYTNPILRLIINGNLICLVLMRCAFAIKSVLGNDGATLRFMNNTYYYKYSTGCLNIVETNLGRNVLQIFTTNLRDDNFQITTYRA